MSLRDVPLTRNSPPSTLLSPSSKASRTMPSRRPCGVSGVSRTLALNCERLRISSFASFSKSVRLAPNSFASIAWNPIAPFGQASISRSSSGTNPPVKTSERSHPTRASIQARFAPTRSPAAASAASARAFASVRSASLMRWDLYCAAPSSSVAAPAGSIPLTAADSVIMLNRAAHRETTREPRTAAGSKQCFTFIRAPSGSFSDISINVHNSRFATGCRGYLNLRA